MVMFKESVSEKKKFLSSLIKAPLRTLSHQARDSWRNTDELTGRLHDALCRLPHCQLLYAIGTDGKQISGNVTRNGTENKWHGQDLSERPYMNDSLPFKGMVLSAVYLSQRSMQPCITAIQAVLDNHRLLGFVAADFHVKDLPAANTATLNKLHYQKQSHFFREHNQRHTGSLDRHIDYLIYVWSTLMQEHGIFQCHVHFDSDVCALSSLDDPLRYQLFDVQELMDPELFELYPKMAYDSRNHVSADKIPNIFAQFKVLRQLDDDTYIRSGALNLVNGQVSVNLSLNGTRFMGVDEFLNKNLTDWLTPEINTETTTLEITTPN